MIISFFHVYDFPAGVHEARIQCIHFTSFAHASYMFHACISLLGHICNQSSFDLIGGTAVE